MSNGDELIQYFIVNEDLVDKNNQPVKMSGGKLAVQVAHAEVDITLHALNTKDELFEKWYRNPLHKKIILRAHKKVFDRIFNESDLWWARTLDFGLTEIAPHQLTVIGLMPMYKNDLPKYIQRLQLYKD